jgi:hypothetical protein
MVTWIGTWITSWEPTWEVTNMELILCDVFIVTTPLLLMWVLHKQSKAFDKKNN